MKETHPTLPPNNSAEAIQAGATCVKLRTRRKGSSASSTWLHDLDE